jgi:hypothetical protein
MSIQKKANLVGTIEDLLAAVGAEEKQAAHANTEAGGFQGSSTHPVTKVDDKTDDAVEGARSAENTSDVKSEPNRGQTVDETTPGPGAGQDSVQTDVGITSKATGEDSGAETDSAKSGKEDGGTFQGSSTHPARTDNDSLDGHKYSADLRTLCKQAEDIGGELLAALAVSPNRDIAKRAEHMTSMSYNASGEPAALGQEESFEAKSAEAAQAGYDLAGVFSNLDIPAEDKQAADMMVVDTIGNVIATAGRRADKAAEFYHSHFTKLAEGEEEALSEEEALLGEEDAGAPMLDGAGGLPPEEGGLGEEGLGGDGGEMEALMQLLAQGEEMGGEEALGGMAGGEEMGGLGGEELGGLGGEEGGEDEMAMLEQVLQELGVTPEELEQAVAAEGGGGGEMGAEDPAAALAGGAPPMDPAAMAAMGGGAPGMEAQASWLPKTASDLQKYAKMRDVIQEITNRSRG